MKILQSVWGWLQSPIICEFVGQALITFLHYFINPFTEKCLNSGY